MPLGLAEPSRAAPPIRVVRRERSFTVDARSCSAAQSSAEDCNFHGAGPKSRGLAQRFDRESHQRPELGQYDVGHPLRGLCEATRRGARTRSTWLSAVESAHRAMRSALALSLITSITVPSTHTQSAHLMDQVAKKQPKAAGLGPARRPTSAGRASPGAARVRKPPSRPRCWPNFSLLQLCSHRNAWANLHLLGPPNTFLARAPRRAAGQQRESALPAGGDPGGPRSADPAQGSAATISLRERPHFTQQAPAVCCLSLS
jgi:hypothetical protein